MTTPEEQVEIIRTYNAAFMRCNLQGMRQFMADDFIQ